MRDPSRPPDNELVKSSSDVPIAEEEKRELVRQILESETLSKPGDISARLLLYLLEMHLQAPDAPPTQKQILEAVWLKGQRSDEDPTVKVRNAVIRVRERLAKFFLQEGSKQRVLLTIPVNGYALDFQRRADDAKVLRDWFWGTYLDRKKLCFFGLVPSAQGRFRDPRSRSEFVPDEQRKGRVYPILRTYRHFARVLSPRNLKIVPFGWEAADCRNYVAFSHNIFIGDDESFEDGLIRIDNDNDMGPADDSDQLSYVASDHFELTMLRIKDQTTVLNGKGAPFLDTEETAYALLTRFTSKFRSAEQTVLCARSIITIEKVARFINSKAGLSEIESLPRMREATKELRRIWSKFDPERDWPIEPRYRGGAPYDFQILFSTSIDREERVSRGGPPRVDKKVEIVTCSVPKIVTNW